VARPKTRVYIDGYNLYHGAVQGTPYKWLNIELFCELLLPKNEITQIKYFTASASDTPDSPDRSVRQRIFWRALDTLPKVRRYEGNFVSRPKRKPLAPARRFDKPDDPSVVFLRDGEPPQWAIVHHLEEKGSDVNLATHLLADGFRGMFHVAVVISNDTDLVEPIRVVSQELLLAVGIVNPRPNPLQPKLAAVADFKRQVDKRLLRKCLFPDTLADRGGEFSKPITW